MKRLLSAVLALLLLVCCAFSASAADLSFGQDGSFRILLLADPQDDATPEPDMAPLIEAAIRKTQPDLIVVLGDLVEDWGVSTAIGDDGKEYTLSYDETLANCRTTLDAVFAPIIASGIPYTAVLGNNDYLSGLSAEDWYALLRQQKSILLPETAVHADGRMSNILPVCDTDGTQLLRLFLMDTGRNGVTNEQVRWFRQANDDRVIPSLVFQHIPVPEMGYLWRFCFPWEEGAVYRGKFITLRLNPRIAVGDDHGRLCDSGISGEFRAWKVCGNVIGAYFGHVHNISAEGTYKGVRLGLVYSDRWNGKYQHGCALLTFDKQDVRNYTWTAYRYTGSVETGDASLDEETYTRYPTYTGLAWLQHQWELFRGYILEKLGTDYK